MPAARTHLEGVAGEIVGTQRTVGRRVVDGALVGEERIPRARVVFVHCLQAS